MKSKLILTIALFLALFAVTAVRADETTLTGVVAVVAAEGGDITAITLTVGEKAYSVVLDEKGKALAELKGKTVKVTGTVAGEEGKQTITVSASEEVKAE